MGSRRPVPSLLSQVVVRHCRPASLRSRRCAGDLGGEVFGNVVVPKSKRRNWTSCSRVRRAGEDVVTPSAFRDPLMSREGEKPAVPISRFSPPNMDRRSRTVLLICAGRSRSRAPGAAGSSTRVRPASPMASALPARKGCCEPSNSLTPARRPAPGCRLRRNQGLTRCLRQVEPGSINLFPGAVDFVQWPGGFLGPAPKRLGRPVSRACATASPRPAPVLPGSQANPRVPSPGTAGTSLAGPQVRPAIGSPPPGDSPCHGFAPQRASSSPYPHSDR